MRFSHVCFPPVAVERSCFVVAVEEKRKRERSSRKGRERGAKGRELAKVALVRTWRRAGRSVRTQRWLL